MGRRASPLVLWRPDFDQPLSERDGRPPNHGPCRARTQTHSNFSGVPCARVLSDLVSSALGSRLQALVPETLFPETWGTMKTHSGLTDTPSPAEAECAIERSSEISMENPLEFGETTRRDILRKAVFIAPVILTLPVIPSFAKAGSDGADEHEHQGDHGEDGDSIVSSGSQSDRRRRRHHHWLFFSW
jgi:hypothetical protein